MYEEEGARRPTRGDVDRRRGVLRRLGVMTMSGKNTMTIRCPCGVEMEAEWLNTEDRRGAATDNSAPHEVTENAEWMREHIEGCDKGPKAEVKAPELCGHMYEGDGGCCDQRCYLLEGHKEGHASSELNPLRRWTDDGVRIDTAEG